MNLRFIFYIKKTIIHIKLNWGGNNMFKWKEEFSVGIDKFDKQHKKLLKLGQELLYSFENVEEGIDQYDKIIKVLNEMHDYTVYHFNSEEEIMEKYNYPEINKHKKAHQQFVDKLEEIEPKKIDLNQKGFSMELINFIANWIENHIMGEDQKYKSFLKNKNIE